MTLPAHRHSREERKKNGGGGKVFVFDFDETITTAPKLMAHLATALRANGDTVYVLTGNDSPRDELIARLTDDYKFPFDDLVQYHDSQSDGIARAHYLKQMGAWCGIDNRIDRAGTYVQVAPHLFLVAEPPKVAEEDAQGSKKKAKKAAKKLKRLALHADAEKRGAAPQPPNYRPADTPGECCGTCEMFDNGVCWGYGNTPVAPDHVCDSWTPDE